MKYDITSPTHMEKVWSSITINWSSKNLVLVERRRFIENVIRRVRVYKIFEL